MHIVKTGSLAGLLLVSAALAQAQERAPRAEDRSPRFYGPDVSVMVPPMPIDIEPMIFDFDMSEIAPMALDAARLGMEIGPLATEAAELGVQSMALAQADMALSMLSEMPMVRVEPRYSPRVNVREPVQGDPADSLYRSARSALTRNNFKSAADLFARIRSQYPKSTYMPDALYWGAYALWRQGGDARLREAAMLLERVERDHPKAGVAAEAARLATQIQGRLARDGDAAAAERVTALAAAEVTPLPPGTPAPAAAPAPPGVTVSGRPGARVVAPRPPRPPRLGRVGSDQVPDGCSQEDYDDKVTALQALLQMNSDQALPILKKVLAKRDECSAPLRRRAVFLVSQQRSPESADILLDAVKNDPDPEVRRQGVYFLGQVDDARAITILGEILKVSTDLETQKRSIFALSQHKSAEAVTIIKQYAERADAPDDLRKQAIYAIGEQPSPENAAYLRALYGKITDEEIKKYVLYAVTQMRGQGNSKWLLDIAANTNESLEMRKNALYQAGQLKEADFAAFAGLYDKMPDREMKKQLIYVYSQRKEAAAVDRLMEIARTEKDSELRRSALFWLANSGDPRAVKVYEEILNR